MWNSEFNCDSPSYLDSDYCFNTFPDEGSESSSNLPIPNEYDNLYSFLDDWLHSDMSEYNSVDCYADSGIDLSSSSLPFSPFPSVPMPSNSYSYSYSDPTGFNSNIVGEGGDNSMETMGLNNGEIQFSGSQIVSVTELEQLVEPREERNRGESSSREPKKHKPSNEKNVVEEASRSATKKKGAAKKSQRLGPKIAALQRLISPYGKTDAASVLYETATNIKYLHEQIRILSAPYMGRHRQQSLANMGCDLSSRGLCLVPVTTELVNLTSKMASTFHLGSTLASTHSGPGSTLASTRSGPGSTLAAMHTVPGSTLASIRSVPGSTLASIRSVPGSTLASTCSVPGSTLASMHTVPGSTLALRHTVPGSTLASMHTVPGNALASAGSVPGNIVPFSNLSIPGSALPFSRFSL